MGTEEVLQKAETFREGRELVEALAQYKKVLLSVRPPETRERAQAYRGIAAVKSLEGKYAEAELNLLKASEVEDDAETRRQLIEVCAHQNAFDRALGHHRRLIALLGPGVEQVAALTALCNAAKENGRFDASLGAEVERDLMRVCEVAPPARLNALRLLDQLYAGDARRTADRVEVLRGLVRLAPDDRSARRALAGLLSEHAPKETEQLVATLASDEPRDADLVRWLFDLRLRTGDNDGAVRAAKVLGELGASDLDDDLLLEQHAAAIAARPARPLSHDERRALWPRRTLLADVFFAVGRAAARAKVDLLRASKQLFVPTGLAPLDKGGTSTFARSLEWASAMLGVESHAIWLDPNLSSMLLVPAEVPTSVVGEALLSGRSSSQVAFLAARHLFHGTPECAVLAFYPTEAELEQLLVASVACLCPDVEMAITGEAQELARRLDTKFETEERIDARVAVAAFLDGQERIDVRGFVVDAERSANRAGIFLCGDLRASLQMIEAESRDVAGLSSADRANDALGFTLSAAYGELRRSLAISLRPSIRPPIS